MTYWNLFVASALLLSAACPTVSAAELIAPTTTISLKGVNGKLDHLAVDNKGERLFIANKPNNTLDIVDLKSGAMVRQIADQGKVSGVAFASNLNIIYVGNGVGTCNAFDGTDYRQVFSAKAPGADNVHYHSGNNMVYVGGDEGLSEIDAKSGEIKSTIKLPGSIHGFKIDKNAGKIYTVQTKPNLVAVVDIANHSVIDQFPLTLSDAGSPIAQDTDNGLLFVGCPKTKPMVVVFDIKTGKEIANVIIPGGIDDLHYDKQNQRLYASCSDSALVVIERKGERYDVVKQLETPKDSRTCIWSHGTLYLGVPRHGDKDGPEVRLFKTASASE